MTLKVLIADDECLARGRLRQLLEAEPGVQIVGECITGLETLQAIRKHAPHLVLLDVGLPEMDGFQVVQALSSEPLPLIVFVTAHPRFALRAFEAAALDYLLKPFDRPRLQEALRRAREATRSQRARPDLEEVFGLVTALQALPKTVDRFVVRSGRRLLFVKPNEIDWIRSADNYSELHVGDQVHLLRQTLGELEARLPPRFVRISRSLMVNADQIQELRSKSHGDYLVLMKGGPELTASRNYRAELLKLIGRVDA